MFRDKAVQTLVDLLETRGVFLYHACQYTDLISYLQCYGVPARARLETSRLSFTRFETDDTDRKKGVWSKVFVNLSDYGSGFAIGQPGVPNPYGPIVLKLDPQALLDASDVAICLRSAGGGDFDRQHESLTTAEQVEQLFRYPASAGRPRSAWVKYRRDLQADFGPRAVQPEVSCTVDGDVLRMDHVLSATVDPYWIEGVVLVTSSTPQ